MRADDKVFRSDRKAFIREFSMLSLYVHIPFCVRKCHYCGFYSTRYDHVLADAYLDALEREMDLKADVLRTRAVGTLYVGGGTPTALTSDQLSRLFALLERRVRVHHIAEVTVEVNPAAAAPHVLQLLQRSGVTRLSIGVQSFLEEELRFLGRIHGAAEARAVVRRARGAGFANISLDLIYGLPGQRPAAWRRSLDEALALGTEHLSAYNLIVEESTPLARMVRAGRVAPNTPASDAELYALTMDLLADAGYEQYEVSNYARPGRHCRHNLAYWTHEPYLGFGPSAHSFWRDACTPYGRRWWNRADLAGYAQMVGRGLPPRGGEETLGPREALLERILLGLRSDGVNLAGLREEFGWSPEEGSGGPVEELLAASLATLRRGVLRLTRRGYLLCDEITARLTPDSVPAAP